MLHKVRPESTWVEHLMVTNYRASIVTNIRLLNWYYAISPFQASLIFASIEWILANICVIWKQLVTGKHSKLIVHRRHRRRREKRWIKLTPGRRRLGPEPGRCVREGPSRGSRWWSVGSFIEAFFSPLRGVYTCEGFWRKRLRKQSEPRRHDTQHNDIEHNDTQNNGIICGTQHNWRRA
jgi:hypothetical protein